MPFTHTCEDRRSCECLAGGYVHKRLPNRAQRRSMLAGSGRRRKPTGDQLRWLKRARRQAAAEEALAPETEEETE